MGGLKNEFSITCEEKVVYIKYPLVQNCDDEYLLASKLFTSFHFNVPSNIHVEILCLNVCKYVHYLLFAYIFFFACLLVSCMCSRLL